MVKDCVAWLADADARLPSVVIVGHDASGSVAANVTVSIDGAAPRPIDGTAWDVDPGPHTFTFVTSTGSRTDKSVLVLEGQKSQRVDATFGVVAPPPPIVVAPAPESPGHGRRVLGVAVGSVGLAGAVAGGVFGGLAFSAWSSSKNACPTHVGCPQSAVDDHNHASTFATVSDASLIAGGVLVAAGVTLYLTAPKDGAPTVGLQVLPGGLAIAGRF